MLLAMQTSNARQNVYKAIVQAQPPQLDFILAATQVSYYLISLWIVDLCL